MWRLCVGVDGLPSSALSSQSGPGSAPPPSSTLDNFAPAAPTSSSLLAQQPPSAAANAAAAGGKLAYRNCGPPTSSQGPPQPIAGPAAGAPPPAGRPGPPPPVVDGAAAGAMAGFMPQQSQVFVFSTSMANLAAEAVEQGVYRTIIDFHLDQPRTRQFLQVSATIFPPSATFCTLPGGGNTGLESTGPISNAGK